MLTVKVKMIEDMKVRIVLECATNQVFKPYKAYSECYIEDKEMVTKGLTERALRYFGDLEEGLKDIIDNEKYSVTRDFELGLDIIKVNIPKSMDMYFDAEELTRLRHETSEFSNDVKVRHVLKMLRYNLKNVSDLVDLLG